MHRVVKSHLDAFVEQFGIRGDEAKEFESFLNYSIFRSFSAESIDPNDLVYSGDDPGIDGVMVFLDDSYVSSKEEVEEYFKSKKRDVDAAVIFTQAKRGETWNKSEINNFQSAVLDFLGDEPSYPHSEFLAEAADTFNAVIKNVGRLSNGKPRVEAFFATTARIADAREILAARIAMEKSLRDIGYFSKCSVELVDRDKVVDFWNSAQGQVEATLKVIGMAAFPKAPGIEEGYVITVQAKEFINELLTDANGRMRQRIFEDNVRDFIGLDSEINSEISETLQDSTKQQRFGILNNGVTIISPDVKVTGTEIFMRDFQIVNGCQTSNILFANREHVTDDTSLMMKVVETSENDVVDDIVRSTNRQSKVEEDQFLATMRAVKTIERYFDAKGAEEEYRLYFERRKNQFSSHDNVKAIRLFDIKEISRCVAAMFLDKPDVASRYPNRLTGELRDLVFDASYSEEPYHLSAYTLYRLKLLFGNGRLDPRLSKLRWHILMAIKYFVLGSDVPHLNSKKIGPACAKIEDFVSKNDDASLNQLRELCGAIVDSTEISRDRLKGASLTIEIKDRSLAARARLKP